MYLDVDVETRRGGKMGSEDVAFCQQDVVQNRSVNMRRFSSWYGIGAGERGRENIPFLGQPVLSGKGHMEKEKEGCEVSRGGVGHDGVGGGVETKAHSKKIRVFVPEKGPTFPQWEDMGGSLIGPGGPNPDHRRPVIPLRNRNSMLAGLRCSMKDTAERPCRNAGIGAHPLCPRGMMSMLGRDMFVGGGQEGLGWWSGRALTNSGHLFQDENPKRCHPRWHFSRATVR